MELPSSRKKETILFWIGCGFVIVDAIALTIAPAVRARSWQVNYANYYGLAALVWVLSGWVFRRFADQAIPDRDPYLFPAAFLLTGWGILSIWRLSPYFGLRQTIWLGVAVLAAILIMKAPSNLGYLWRFKYLWLTSGLILTGLTLFLGTNPSGSALPKLWLGCCGVYFQPSEPLKFFLIVYLAAYLAGSNPIPSMQARSDSLLPFLTPTFIMTGLALALLVVQRDLGTASIFLFVYSSVVFLATNRRRIILSGLIGLGIALLVGTLLFEVVRIRVDAWINPWLDPSGRSYQIVQSLLAVANGGLFGRGPGMGSPGLVPVPHSDFIYAAITEENGLFGSIGILGLIAIIVVRGLEIALRSHEPFQRYLAGGIAVHFGGQSILIIGGNLRLLPLTGVTLPFVSYGGSSLTVSFLMLAILLVISHQKESLLVPGEDTRPYVYLGSLFLAGLSAAALSSGWFGIYRSGTLLTRTDNVRRSIDDRFVVRGSILDRNDQSIVVTIGRPSQYYRSILYPPLSVVTGYLSPVYGEAGLEAGMDDWLRGLNGYPALVTWWNHLLYGQPPPGLDVRTSLDLDIQKTSDNLLAGHSGALVLLNARTGEILAMASAPGFNANTIEDQWSALVSDQESPLLDRATLGHYASGDLKGRLFPEGLQAFGLQDTPDIRLGEQAAPPENSGTIQYVSPLQAALIAACLTNQGVRPAAELVNSVQLPQTGWVALPSQDRSVTVFTPSEANARIRQLAVSDQPLWQAVAQASNGQENVVSWFVGGTLPEWQGLPLSLAVVLEEDNPQLAEQIGQAVLQAAMQK